MNKVSSTVNRTLSEQKPYPLGSQVYWVGKMGIGGDLDCHPYLIIEGDEAVLLDPGSPLDFPEVKANVESIISLDKIKLIIVHHQDPDLCASLPLFNQAGLNCPIALHWRTGTMVRYYGISNEFYHVNEKRWEWQFSSGRRLTFIPAPYCHFPGAIMTYDSTSKILFSGDIFGAFVKNEPSLFINENYINNMITFHEHYMPEGEYLSSVMSKIEPLSIKMIAPQHGRIINKDIPLFISTLYNLKCGSMFAQTPDERGSGQQNRNSIITLINRLYLRLKSLYPLYDFAKLFMHTSFTLNDDKISLKESSGNTGLDEFLTIINEWGDENWVTIIQPYLLTLLNEYHLPIPKVLIFINPDLNGERFTHKSSLIKVDELVKNTEDHLLHDKLTGLQNQIFFESFIDAFLIEKNGSPWALMYIGINNLMEINRIHGREAGDETLTTLGYLLENFCKAIPGSKIFKLNAPVFAMVVEVESGVPLNEKANAIIKLIRDSTFFMEKINVAIGVSHSRSWKNDVSPMTFNELDKLNKAKMLLADERGVNNICDELETLSPQAILQKRVLFVEPDDSYFQLLESSLKEKGVYITRVNDGALALDRREGWNPDLIVAEAMTPKVNGFQLKEKLNALSGRSDTPFVLISQRKDEEYIRRAASLRILHYLKKPFSLIELEGLILNLLE